MAIYHCSVKIISRSSGRSAVGASAYRSGEKIENEREGITHDYTKKSGIEHKEIHVPKNAPEWASDRARLWNEVEKIEKAKNSQLSREVEVALPRELTKEQRIELVRDYVKENFTSNGMVADVAIHNKGDGNPHAHIMLTMRPFEENGEWGAKARKEYTLDSNGEKIKLKSGQYKSRKIDTTDWNRKESLKKWRENWEKAVNGHLKKNGHEQQVDHRSYKEQGVDKIPTKHEGPIAREIEKRGGKSYMVEANKRIEEENRIIEQLNTLIARAEITKKQELDNVKEQELQELQEKKDLELRELRKKEEEQAKSSIFEREETKVHDIMETKDIEFAVRDKREDIGADRHDRGSITSLEGDASLLANIEVNYSKLGELERQRKFEIKELENTKETIEKHEGLLKSLEEQRKQVKGWFKGAEKKRLDMEIEKEKKILEGHEKALRKDYDLDKTQLNNKIDALKKESERQRPERESITEKLNRIREEKAVERIDHREKNKSHNSSYDRGGR